MKITLTTREEKKGVKVRFNPELPETRFVIEGKQEYLDMKIKKHDELSRREWLILIRRVIRTAKAHKITHLSLDWEELVRFVALKGDSPQELGRLVSENMLLASYEFRRYKERPKGGFNDVQGVALQVSTKDLGNIKKGVAQGQVVSRWANFCRDLANTPGNDMTPKKMVAAVREAVKGKKVSFKVYGQSEMRQKGFGGVLAVGQGSKEESQFLILEYKGGSTQEKPIVLVGKGVTFDTGGIDTKPHPYGLEMMMDMSGGAAVIATLLIAEELKMKKNLVALIPAVENMPGGESFRPGDVIKMLGGVHVEIGHTDAEGRLILADAITYAKKWKPDIIIDVATLTGAASVALGERATAVFTKDDVLAEKTLIASEEAGDYAWRLPLWAEYEGEIAGTVGDISNIRTKGRDGVGGAITAATFLHYFAKDHPKHMHLDMAPTMTAAYDEELAKGAKGSPVRLLTRLLEQL